MAVRCPAGGDATGCVTRYETGRAASRARRKVGIWKFEGSTQADSYARGETPQAIHGAQPSTPSGVRATFPRGMLALPMKAPAAVSCGGHVFDPKPHTRDISLRHHSVILLRLGLWNSRVRSFPLHYSPLPHTRCSLISKLMQVKGNMSHPCWITAITLVRVNDCAVDMLSAPPTDTDVISRDATILAEVLSHYTRSP